MGEFQDLEFGFGIDLSRHIDRAVEKAQEYHEEEREYTASFKPVRMASLDDTSDDAIDRLFENLNCEDHWAGSPDRSTA